MRTSDVFADHTVTKLVPDQDTDEYLRALDRAYNEREPGPSWFKGQGVNVDIDGTIDSEWSWRQEYSQRYSEL